ncbi:unnamed protein product [Rotaria sordida]|uniref:ETS domain-containing protein n=1 Tax=Rotaria sordida TaxID=392033 RepID=A0A819FWN3_9BILA|nr:unnamed protein product [Rotaria sordida]CAF0962676.1 unnamed protein product [Rotaria sordida]CAF0996317.1 unnamed protein product [Rotaria sordida]CAF1014403.1 unnamed protein product [Rotaria sordida]CAF1052545.1 unnamed protein product [Rotaria sordida]
MWSPLFISQPSWDLGVYLPSELDFEDTIVYQSPEVLLRSFNINTASSAHRSESELFDLINNDMEAISTLTDSDILSIDDNTFDTMDVAAYFSGQCTVASHIPIVDNKKTLHDNKPLPVSSNRAYKSQKKNYVLSSELCIPSKFMNIKEFHVYDNTTGRFRRPLLHEFIRLILENDEYSHIAEYIDRKRGIFKLYQPDVVADLWKQVKGRNSDNNMTYDKLARALRYYYGNGIMYPSPGRFTFRFGPKSGFGISWRPAD